MRPELGGVKTYELEIIASGEARKLVKEALLNSKCEVCADTAVYKEIGQVCIVTPESRLCP